MQAHVGQIWRDDLDGYLYKVIAIDEEGRIWVRHPNATAQSPWPVNPGWFDRWILTRG